MKQRVLHLLGVVVAASLGFSAPATAEEPASPKVLVELYTSQGCSSCPAADSLLGDLAKREDVVALSLHVDYWDYLGWRDTFAQSKHTQRQYDYRESFGARVVYTPQMIIQGTDDVVGSREGDVNSLIDAALGDVQPASIEVSETGGTVSATLTPGAVAAPSVIWVARYTRAERVAIGRGENRGREITYHNVVRSLERIGNWAGAAEQEVTLPQPAEDEGVAVWLQSGETGPVYAAAKFEP